MLETAYERFQRIENFRIVLKDVVSNQKLDELEDLIFGNTCETNNPFDSVEECEAFEDGITLRGLSVMVTNFLYRIRSLMISYELGYPDIVAYPFNSLDHYQARIYILSNHRNST